MADHKDDIADVLIVERTRRTAEYMSLLELLLAYYRVTRRNTEIVYGAEPYADEIEKRLK
jgi:hypothetical protein